MLKNKKIFISGGAGVIGREMIPKLIALGAKIFVGDLKSCPQEWRGQVQYRQGDLNFLEASEIEDFAPEIFIHLAATFERSEESYEFWNENFWHNMRLSNHLMTLVKDLPSLKKIVFASSYLIYDPSLYNFNKPQYKPVCLSENDSIYPRNLTGMAKLAHEIELRFINQFNCKRYKVVMARIFRGYGRGSRDVISRWVRSLLANQQIEVYKKEGFFDYIYAADTAEGLIRLSAAPKAQGIVNLGTGKAKKLSDVLKVLKGYFPKMKTKEGKKEKTDILFEASQAKISRLFNLTQWKPKYDIEKAIPEIIEYERSEKTDHSAISVGNILVSSSSHKVPLIYEVKKAAAKFSTKIKVFAGDLNKDVITSFVADEFWNMPATKEANVKTILNWCLENNVKYIIPTRDGELPFWANHKKMFASKGINIMISVEEAVKRCLDKLEFSRFCLSSGIPAIPSYEDIDLCPGKLFVVKEKTGAGSISLGIKLDHNNAKKHADNLDQPIFQPYIEGTEISADAYVDKQGAIHGLVLRTRDKIVNGESQITTTLDNKKVEKILLKCIKKLGLYGHIILQAIIDNNDQVHIIECNCRFGGASTLSVKAGLDSFYWFLLESSCQKLKDYPFNRAEKQIRQVRVPFNIYL